MRIYIVRHGETDANKKGYAQGRTDDPLNKNGEILGGSPDMAIDRYKE